MQEGGEKSPGLARALGSTDRDTREKGLVLLFNWLESHENISQKDLIRLWKALYFCFWHSDLVSVQVRHACETWRAKLSRLIEGNVLISEQYVS